MNPESLSRDYFEAIYHANADPWEFATSAYEREKYARTLSYTPQHARRALEIGCSIGVFTRELAARCAELVAIDISERAVAAARARCDDLPNVTIARAAFPHDALAGTFDSIVVSEVAYYWSDADFAQARERIAELLAESGQVVLTHYLPKVDAYVRDGDAVHEAFLDDPRFRSIAAFRAERYRIDVLAR